VKIRIDQLSTDGQRGEGGFFYSTPKTLRTITITTTVIMVPIMPRIWSLQSEFAAAALRDH